MADVTDYAAVRQVARDAERQLGQTDHVVFAVGAGSGKFGFPFWKLEPADWERVLKINLIGAVNLAHAFGPSMAAAATVQRVSDNNLAEAGSPARSMLFLSSVAGQIGSQTDPPYSAAKAALINFAQCAAKDLAPSGVRVNTLCPGMVQTPLNRGVYEAWAGEQPESERSTYEAWTADKIKKLVPLNRWQEPEDIAAMAVFLASTQGATSPARPSMSMAGMSCIGRFVRYPLSVVRAGRGTSPRRFPEACELCDPRKPISPRILTETLCDCSHRTVTTSRCLWTWISKWPSRTSRPR